jgi:nucleoside-diphosphate-sugar epimerase
MLPSGSLRPYVATKRAAEILIGCWQQHFERLVIFRPFFMYGSRQPSDRLLSNILSAIKNGNPVKLANGKGLVFNPVHVYDAARFVLMAMQSGSGFDIYNVAGLQTAALKDVVTMIAELLHKSPHIEYTDGIEDVLLGSIDKMKSIGFNHEIDLQAGIREMIFGLQRNSVPLL